MRAGLSGPHESGIWGHNTMLTGLDHIQLAIPPGGEDAAQQFYCDILGLTKVAKPRELEGRGGLWLAGPGIALHLGIQSPFHPAQKAHPAFVVRSLAETKAHLAAMDVAYTADADLPGITRIFVADPFGNRIELLEHTSPADGG